MNRHERRKAEKMKTRVVEVPARPIDRVMKFLCAFHDAPNDADIEVRIGRNGAGDAAVLVTISGGGEHGMMVHEARKVADMMDDAMRAHPTDPDAATLPNIIMALRAACDHAESADRNGLR